MTHCPKLICSSALWVHRPQSWINTGIPYPMLRLPALLEEFTLRYALPEVTMETRSPPSAGVSRKPTKTNASFRISGAAPFPSAGSEGQLLRPEGQLLKPGLVQTSTVPSLAFLLGLIPLCCFCASENSQASRLCHHRPWHSSADRGVGCTVPEGTGPGLFARDG